MCVHKMIFCREHRKVLSQRNMLAYAKQHEMPNAGPVMSYRIPNIAVKDNVASCDIG